MRPCFMSEEEYETGWKQSVFYVDGNYMEEYRKHMIAMSHIAQIAKSYVLKNWKSVTDWSDLDIKITMSKVTTHYYKYTDTVRSTGRLGEILKKFEQELKEKQNPVVSVSNVVLDPVDGDFSLDINGNHHRWILDDEVITLADYIEKQLKTKNKEG